MLQDIFKLNVLLLLTFALLCGCEQNDNPTPGSQNTETTAAINSIMNRPVSTETPPPAVTAQLKPEKNYLFDLSEHSIEEMYALLNRAAEVAAADPNNFADVKVVMVLHGPDIDWFTSRNLPVNRELIELAARLDEYEIIDMKICEATMLSRGINRNEIPDFIESVTHAETEINTLTRQGYINL